MKKRHAHILLNADLKAEAVTGVTLRGLTGAGTVTSGTRRRRTRTGPTRANRRQATVKRLCEAEAALAEGDFWTAVHAHCRTSVLQAAPDPQSDPEDDHVETHSDHQHRRERDGKLPDRQHRHCLLLCEKSPWTTQLTSQEENSIFSYVKMLESK